MEDHSLDGIAVGRDDKTNTIVSYSPVTRSYYRPPAFRLDEHRLPITNFPKHIRYDGGLTCGLMRNNNDPVPEPFPPGTRVTLSINDAPVRGTIQNIPMIGPTLVTSAANPSPTALPPPHYVVSLDDGTTAERSFEDLIAIGRDSDTPADSAAPTADPFATLPHIFQRNSKVTFDHKGTFHKGFLQHSDAYGFHFEARRNIRSKRVDWTVPLPNFKQHWTTLVGDDILFPGHTAVSSFLKSATADSAPAARFVSAKNLFAPCPPSLSKALHPSNPDRQVWLDSYNEEKGGLESMDVYEKISKKQYLLLRRKGLIPKAIPSMCVLVVKPDRDGKPSRAKSRIVVLGNFEDRLYAKARRYAPVLKYDSLRLLTSNAVSHRRVLQQGDCKNAFCQATLPDDEKMAIRPPVGDPAYANDELWLLNKTLYGLRRSPHHWYNKFTSILRSLGLTASPNDPCLYTGVVNPSLLPVNRRPLTPHLFPLDPPRR